MLMENFSPWGGVCPYPGAIYMYIFIIMKNLLTLKPLGQSKPNFIWSILGKGGKVYINGQGHMTKMAAMAINRKKNL